MNVGIEAVKFVQSIKPNNQTTTPTNGTSVDCRGYREAAVIFDLGDITGTTPTADVKVQDSPDGSTDWQDVTGAAFPQRTDSTDAVTLIGKVMVKNERPHMRAVLTMTGASAAARCGVCFALQGHRGTAVTALSFNK